MQSSLHQLQFYHVYIPLFQKSSNESKKYSSQQKLDFIDCHFPSPPEDFRGIDEHFLNECGFVRFEILGQ